jgi:hypothetical protein
MEKLRDRDRCHVVFRLGLVASIVILIGVGFIAQLPTAFGQGATGAINGTVLDSSGGAVPGARILLQNTATGAQRPAITNTAGSYGFPGVLPGTYSMQVSAEGFATAKEESFVLNVNDTQTHNFSLQVGSTKQEVTISATAAHVEASTAELGTVVAAREVEDLPLNGRNFTQLLTLTPGVSPISTAQNSSGGGMWAGNTIGTFSYPSVNGQCNRCNFFLLDGFNDDGTFFGVYATAPIIDMVQEFKVQSHNDSAAYGGALGGIVNVVTKSGTNEYHGDAWEFLRNNALDARNFFSPDTVPYKQNQFGGTIGGPLLPGHFRKGAPKTWFYAAYEGFRSVKSSNSLLNVPTSAELGGDLSALAETQIYNPFSTRPDPVNPGEYLRDPFMCDAGGNPLPATNGIQAAGTACNKIPQSMIATGLVKYLQADIPSPTNTGFPGYNAVDTTPSRLREDTASLRFDHQFNERTSAWLRYTGFTQPDSLPTGYPGTTSKLYEHGYQGAASITRTFGDGSKVLTAGFGRNSYNTNQISAVNFPANTALQLGFSPGFIANLAGIGLGNPGIGIAGFDSQPGVSLEYTHMANVYEWKGDFVWVHGRHTLQMGADFSTNNADSPIVGPSEAFASPQTSNLESPGGTGSGLASFLLGVPDNFYYENLHVTEHGGWVDGAYVQDSWRPTDKLMVNFGLRYDVTLIPIYGTPGSRGNDTPYVGDEDFDKGVYILAAVPPACNPATGIGAPCIPGGVLPDHVIVTPNKNQSIIRNTYDNLGPRLGLAYQLPRNTVIRAGAGIFFDNWAGVQQLAQNYQATWPGAFASLGQNLNYPTSANPLPTITWSDPTKAVLVDGVQLPGPTPLNQVEWFTDPRYQNAYSEQWNFGIQQALGRSTVLEADYVGQHSSRLNVGGVKGTAVTPGPGDISLRQVYPYMTPSYYDKSVGKASYNAFDFKLRRTTSRGLSYIISYTWSKVINIGCDGYFGAEGCHVSDPYNLNASRSVAGFDVPHMLSASWTYDLPFGKGKSYASGNKALDALIGRWALNGIYTIRSGEPFTVWVSGDIANIGLPGNSRGGETANAVGLATPTNRTWQEYINPTSFQVPAAYTFGNSGRNAYRLSHAGNWDISIFRDFRIPINEATRLQFRAEFFNALNYAVLGGGLDLDVRDPNFGTATSTRNTERQVQFAVKLFF